MLYHAEFNKDEKVSKSVTKLFHQDEDSKFLDILEDY